MYLKAKRQGLWHRERESDKAMSRRGNQCHGKEMEPESRSYAAAARDCAAVMLPRSTPQTPRHGDSYLQSCLRHPDVQPLQEELGIFILHFPWKCKQRAQESSAGASSGADAAPRPTAAFPATSCRLGSHVPMQTWWCAVLHGVVVQRRN